MKKEAKKGKTTEQNSMEDMHCCSYYNDKIRSAADELVHCVTGAVEDKKCDKEEILELLKEFSERAQRTAAAIMGINI